MKVSKSSVVPGPAHAGPFYFRSYFFFVAVFLTPAFVVFLIAFAGFVHRAAAAFLAISHRCSLVRLRVRPCRQR